MGSLNAGDTEEPVPAVAPARWLLAAAGILLVGVGAIGAVLPGIPTVGPLMLASICFSKSCPWLEQRLIGHRFFARFHAYLDRPGEMPARARVAALAMMWASIGVSLVCLGATARTVPLVPVLIVVAGGVGSWFICTIGRRSGERCRRGSG